MAFDRSDSGELKDKVVLITGAGRGLGRVLALAYGAAGAKIAINDINPELLEETEELVRAYCESLRVYHVDIGHIAAARAIVAQVYQDFGALDILVNNAAIQPHVPLLEIDSQDWQRVMDVNLNGPLCLIQAAGRIMRVRSAGLILNIATAEAPVQPPNDRVSYFASKAGLVGLTRAAAPELLAYNIRINAICPAGQGSWQEDLV